MHSVNISGRRRRRFLKLPVVLILIIGSTQPSTKREIYVQSRG